MNPEIVLAALVFFHHGDYVPSYEYTFYPCAMDSIYISGLNENHVYIESDNLIFFEDQQIFLLDPTYTSFDIYSNEDHSYIDTIHIRWINEDCEDEIQETEQEEAVDVASVEVIEEKVVENVVVEKSKSEIVADDVIVIEQNSNPDEILKDVYAYEEGEDVSYTLDYEPLETNLPGTYTRTITAKNGLSKDVLVEVVEAEEEAHENLANIDYRLLITLVIIVGVVLAWLNMYIG